MIEKYQTKKESICVVGLGYVGLPVALELARKYSVVVGFDINNARDTVDEKGYGSK
jgi:UDP-N-acetyl-D-galactosamine dehydrogenase